MGKNRRVNTWKRLTRRDLTAFDDYGVKAIEYAMEHGGVGKISTRGHAMLKSPSGAIMGVAPDTRKARQTIAISLREHYGNGGLPEDEPIEAAEREQSPADVQMENPDLVREPTLPCWEPKCDAMFVTEGALYSHAHKEHHVCPEPGCHFTRDNKSHLMAHVNTAHREHPRRKWARLRREAAEAEAAAAKPDTIEEAVDAIVDSITEPEPEPVVSSTPAELVAAALDPADTSATTVEGQVTDEIYIVETPESVGDVIDAIVKSEPLPEIQATSALEEQYPVGTTARIRFKSRGHDDHRVYLAEVVSAFGKPHWGGSWHGFLIPVAEDKVEIVELVRVVSESESAFPLTVDGIAGAIQRLVDEQASVALAATEQAFTAYVAEAQAERGQLDAQIYELQQENERLRAQVAERDEAARRLARIETLLHGGEK